jgi:diketogulonate reductase-like aldo/keto reductase
VTGGVAAPGRIPTVRLDNGVAMPVLGLGLSPWTTEHRPFARFHMHVGRSTRDAITWALELDYRLFDTARRYRNERAVGEAVRDSGVPREEVFITSKCGDLSQGYDGILRCCEASLRELQTEYVDLYLLHWPVTGRRVECWQAMQRLLEQGLCRAVGVSNFTIRHLEELAETSPIVPAVDQVEFSAFLYQRDLLAYCREHGIQLEAYCPLARASRLRHPTLLRVSAKYGVTPAQVLLRWALEHEVIVIPKSFNQKRIAENRDVFAFALDAEDMAALDALDEGLRLNRDPTDVL